MHLIDTDACVDALRGVRGAVEALAKLEAQGPLAVSAVTAHELWQGAYGSHNPAGSAAALEQFLAAFDVVAYDETVAREGGRIAAALAARGMSIGDLDTMIAATAVVGGAKLVTRNTRHFARVAGLTVLAL